MTTKATDPANEPQAAPQASSETPPLQSSEWLDEFLDDLPNAWCQDCEHPRCISKKESARHTIEEKFEEAQVRARMDELLRLTRFQMVKTNTGTCEQRVVKRLAELKRLDSLRPQGETR